MLRVLARIILLKFMEVFHCEIRKNIYHYFFGQNIILSEVPFVMQELNAFYEKEISAGGILKYVSHIFQKEDLTCHV